MHMTNKEIGAAMTIKLDPVLPEYPVFKEGIRRAPMRDLTLSDHEKKLAVKNALRYVPEELHEALAPRIYGRAPDPRPDLRIPFYAKGKDLRKAHRRI